MDSPDVNGPGRPAEEGPSEVKMEVVVDSHSPNQNRNHSSQRNELPQPPATPVRSPPALKLETNLPSSISDDSDSSSSLSPVPSDTAIDLSVIRPPPAKKRKVGDSPPWKSAMTQTPTAFIENGRRKSGRVKILTAQQQQQQDEEMANAEGSPRRRPPAANGTKVKSSPGQVTPGRRSSGGANGVNGSGRRDRKKKREESSPSPGATPRKRAIFDSSESLEPPQPPRRKPGRPPAQKAPPAVPVRRVVKVVKKVVKKVPVKKAKPNKKEAHEAKMRRRAELIAEARRRKKKIPTFSSEDEAENAADDDDEEMEEEEEEEIEYEEIEYEEPVQDNYDFNYSSSDGDAEDDGNSKRPRIKLLVKAPPLMITNHLHILPKPKFASFAEYCDSRELADKPEDLEDAEEAAEAEAEVRARIEEAGRTGVLAQGHWTYDLPEKQVEPTRPLSHQDYLVQHALALRKIRDRERRHLRQLAKKTAMQCAQKVWDARPKSKEELEAEQEERNRRLYKEAAVVWVKKKWAAIIQAVEANRIERAKEELKKEQEKSLKKMLEHSSELLNARRRRGESNEPEEDGSDDDEAEGEEDGAEEEGEDEEDDLEAEMDAQARAASEETEAGDGSGSSSEDDADEEMLSSSDDEEEDEGPGAADDDSKLTVDELRAKYAGLEATAAAASTPSPAYEDEDASMADASPSPSDDEPAHRSTRKSSLAALYGAADDDSLLDEDESDESVEMDSENDEMMSSDAETEDMEGSGSAGEGSEEEYDMTGFYADLYGKDYVKEADKGKVDGEEGEKAAEEEVKSDQQPAEEERAEAALKSVQREASVPVPESAEDVDVPKVNEHASPAEEAVEIAQKEIADNQASEPTVLESNEAAEAVMATGFKIPEEQPISIPPTAPEPLAASEDLPTTSSPKPTTKPQAKTEPEPPTEPEAMQIDSDPDHEPSEPALTTDADEQPAETQVAKAMTAEERAEADGIEFVKGAAGLPEEGELPSDIKTPVPFLLRGRLREYQHYGLDWLAGLYENNTNGILADEMGLGKTIQTIALISHLACAKGVWGPHLVVVPTSVILNWEMEFKKWAPGFKILTYYGSREERALKRKGWLGANEYHVCITSYQLVIQDAAIFKRRAWHYLILDEAHNIKNFRSQRWQTLLNFKANSRLLLTGTPLQNNLVELWSLLYFLMPSGVSSDMPTGFANLKEFQDWFARPVDQIIEHGRQELDEEAKHTVSKLHQVLRPYLLRRLKADVEKQMPAKYEHVVTCRLSKRQRYLYDEFMSLARTRETLASGNYLSIINCLMQLRKVCNHPDLFETRQIVTSFATNRSVAADFEPKDLLVRKRLLEEDEREKVNLDVLNLLPVNKERFGAYEAYEVSRLADHRTLLRDYDAKCKDVDFVLKPNLNTIRGNLQAADNRRKVGRLDTLKQCIYLNRNRTDQHPIYGRDVVALCTINTAPLAPPPKRPRHLSKWFLGYSDTIRSMIPTLEERSSELALTIEKFSCVTPATVCVDLPTLTLTPPIISEARRISLSTPYDPFHQSRVRLSIAFPDKRLLQYDCGKLQHLATLLRDLQSGGHRALIFTQMTKVLDILEQFLNIHGYRYLRLDGATRVEQRQILTDRFNNDPRILVFILSTRSGGLGINLTGADTVIFYDMDWNPAMDKQCQDRCHRIGQTRDVHIYRFVSEHTIESNILKKANQKRMLDDVVIQEGDFTTDYFTKLDIRDMLDGLPIQAPSPPSVAEEVEDGAMEGVEGEKPEAEVPLVVPSIKDIEKKDLEKALEEAEDEEDVAAAKVASKEIQETDMADFVEPSAAAAPKEKAKPETPLQTNGMKENPAKPAEKDKENIEPAPASSAATPALPTPSDAATPTIEPPAQTPGTPAADTEMGETENADEEDEPAHIDEYMLRFVEWDLRDVPVVIPKERDRSKKGKNNKKARIRY